LFHLIATLLVFYFVRDIFHFTEGESLCAALVFGLMASHEYNLVVDTARADILVATFMMLTILLHLRAAKGALFSIGAALSYALALCSKEIAIMALPLLILFEHFRDRWDIIIGRMRRIIPYLFASILFFFYHTHFT